MGSYTQFIELFRGGADQYKKLPLIETPQGRMKYLYGTAVMAALLAGAQAETTDLVSTAMQFLARASSTSEVLTLNLTNLLILLVLKGLILAFGLFSVGGEGLGRARSSDEESSLSVSESEIQGGMCFVMYASGDDSMLPCIQKTACQDPKTAQQYNTAAKFAYKYFKTMGLNFGPRHEIVINALDDSQAHALAGGD